MTDSTKKNTDPLLSELTDNGSITDASVETEISPPPSDQNFVPESSLSTSDEIDINEEALKMEISDTVLALLDNQEIQTVNTKSDSLFEQFATPENNTDSEYPDEIFLLPIKERPFFPAQQLPVLLNKKTWIKTFDAIQSGKCKYIGLIFVDKEEHDKAKPKDFSAMGTLVKIHEPKIKDDYIQLIAEGLQRFEVKAWLKKSAPYKAKVNYLETVHHGSEQELKAYSLALMNAFKELLPLNPLYSEELKYFLNRSNTSDPSDLADFAASLTTADNVALQETLETLELTERMEKVLVLFKQEIEITKVQSKIRKRVEENISDHQRDFLLRQQLHEIQSELGITQDDQTLDINRFEKRLKKLALTKKVLKKAREEVNKLKTLDPQSPEYNVSRSWVDWLVELPWQKYSKDKLDLTRAKKVLDKGHDGLDDVKNRILEFLAVGKLKGGISGSIICFVGPPGVGKTSIGRSIAKSLGRQFYRFSVGGMRDEAEIKGHRRTYIGAMPGKFIHALKECQTANPVIMLDEIDKIGNSFQGDPASALLEVLDPEQNHDFLDHYMDVRFDLSKALFICTANTLDSIPSALLDRMEVIRLSGYITEEKVKIAQNHLWPTLLKESGIKPKQLTITTPAIRQVIEGYAREAGVRNLKKQLAKLIRKQAVTFVTQGVKNKRIHANQLEKKLGQPIFTPEKINQHIGTVTGLAWTSMGGATLTIEASRVHTLNRGFKLSGQLGDVMQESAGIAYSFITAHLKQYNAHPKFFDKAFVHLHVPDGATPKDGPSAGVTIATALLSLARNETVKAPLAMTGELSLTGHVLPVGGIREKVIAAKRIGLTTLILPKDNQKDYQELPSYLKKGITVHFAEHFNDVARLAFSF
ncbi:MAG: endopeptidase La [Thiomicrorhabdus sp.]|nr:endopeptidase La [Thiomicrorhabdus sp.]